MPYRQRFQPETECGGEVEGEDRALSKATEGVGDQRGGNSGVRPPGDRLESASASIAGVVGGWPVSRSASINASTACSSVRR
jgi:hypothetical protein